MGEGGAAREGRRRRRVEGVVARGGRRRARAARRIWAACRRRFLLRSWSLAKSKNEGVGGEESEIGKACSPGSSHEMGPKTLSSRLVAPTGTKGDLLVPVPATNRD